MECLIVSLIIFLAAVSLLLVAIASRGESPWSTACQHVARRFRGVWQPGGWFRGPSVFMQYGAAHVRLTVCKLKDSSAERCVQVTMQQGEVRSRCEIFHRQTRPTLLPAARGLQAVEYDWADFHRRWQVLTSDGDDVRHLLSDGVRLAIDQLRLCPSASVSGETTISLSPGWLVVRKVWRTPRGIDLEEFVERICGLSDQFNLAAAYGIEFVAGDQPQLLDEARCGVCGDGLASDVVVCRRCNTPHHRECWLYGGGCATYGCGGRECVVPGVAALAGPHWENSLGAAERPLKPR